MIEFNSLRDFFKPRIEEKTEVLSLDLSDVHDEKVRAFFSKHAFCESWLNELSVAGWARLARNCECHTLNEMEAAYTETEIGPALLREELFCFAITADGGFWCVSMKNGAVKLIDATASDNQKLFVEHSWEDLAGFVSAIEANDLKHLW